MQSPAYGILGESAPEWGVSTWFNLTDGRETLELGDLSGKVIYLYNFQAWCPGCHSSGFPSLVAATTMFAGVDDIAFVAVQTVFEGFDQNTAARAKAVADSFGLTIPVGHDPGPDNTGSTLMRRYRSGGTPWTVIIGKDGFVYFNDFHAPSGPICKLIDLLRTRE